MRVRADEGFLWPGVAPLSLGALAPLSPEFGEQGGELWVAAR